MDTTQIHMPTNSEHRSNPNMTFSFTFTPQRLALVSPSISMLYRSLCNMQMPFGVASVARIRSQKVLQFERNPLGQSLGYFQSAIFLAIAEEDEPNVSPPYAYLPLGSYPISNNKRRNAKLLHLWQTQFSVPTIYAAGQIREGEQCFFAGAFHWFCCWLHNASLTHITSASPSNISKIESRKWICRACICFTDIPDSKNYCNRIYSVSGEYSLHTHTHTHTQYICTHPIPFHFSLRLVCFQTHPFTHPLLPCAAAWPGNAGRIHGISGYRCIRIFNFPMASINISNKLNSFGFTLFRSMCHSILPSITFTMYHLNGIWVAFVQQRVRCRWSMQSSAVQLPNICSGGGQ